MYYFFCFINIQIFAAMMTFNFATIVYTQRMVAITHFNGGAYARHC